VHEDGGGGGERDDHAGRGAHEHDATAEQVVEARSGSGGDPAGEGIHDVEEELGVDDFYANVLRRVGRW